MSKDLTYSYCVNFTLSHFRDDSDEHDLDSFRRRLNRIGDNVSVTGDLVKAEIHVHTDNPGSALEYGIELAEVSEIRIDNLLEMKRQWEAENNPQPEASEDEIKADEPAKAEKRYGFVAVSLGSGFSQFFQDLNVDKIVEGGQTMNPSVDDLLNAVELIRVRRENERRTANAVRG